MGDSEEEFTTPAQTPLVAEGRAKRRQALLNPPVLDLSTLSSPGLGDQTIRPAWASPLLLPHSSPQLPAGWPPAGTDAQDQPLSAPESRSTSVTDLVKALATVTRTRRAAQAACIDVAASTQAMSDVAAAKRKRELEHARLRRLVEALEKYVNELMANPDEAVFTDVSTGLEDLQGALVKVL